MGESPTMEISPYGMLMLTIIGPLIILFIALIKNRKRLRDIWNLRFRRARTVRADMHLISGRVDTRFLVPDSRGFFTYNTGIYHFVTSLSEMDTKYGVRTLSFTEGQIAPESGTLTIKQVKMEVDEVGDDGLVTKRIMQVPQYMITHLGLSPKLLQISRRDENGKHQVGSEPPVTAQEVGDFIDSNIVQDIQSATIADLQIAQIKLILIIGLGILLLGMIAIYTKANSISNTVDVIKNLAIPLGR